MDIEEDPEIEGLLVILNTVGGDVEAGLALAELIAGVNKPSATLVLGGGHSIEETDAQTRVIADWLNHELTPANYAKSQSLYESLVNAVSTNITISDFASYTPFLEKASDRERPIKPQKTVFDEDL